MGLFNFFKSKSNTGPFVSGKAFNNSTDIKIQKAEQAFDQLRKLNVAADEELKLEYFFYTNSIKKAAKLAAELEKLSYQVKHGISDGDKNLFIVTGWTTKMEMSDEIVGNWIKKMGETGYRFDCDFDGWSANADLDEPNFI